MKEFVFSEVELAIWDRVLEPVPMLFIGLGLGAIIAGLIVYNVFRLSFYRKKRQMKFINAANGVANSVLNIVQMGVVAFTESGMLLFNNKTSLKKLRVEELPQSFADFVDTFIPDKEILMQLRLYEDMLPEQRPQELDEEAAENEKIESVSTRVEIHNRIIQFQFSKPFFPQSTLRGWVVVLEDVTKVARQEQQRRLFVSTVSHELKTPLATINGYSESLIDWGLREKSADQIFNDVLKINEESQRITAIIANLTFLSQIENNKDKIDMRVYRIDKAVEEICRKYQEEARKKGIRLYYQSLTRNMPVVFGSKSMMEQMVGNLINNALKYSARNTGVWVFIQGHENTVTIKVQDQGKGIPRPDVEKVFNAFFRVDESGSRAAGGSGLGLAIVKMMAEVQEGSVDLVTRCADDEESASQRAEVGSDFYITVPTAVSVFRETLEGIRDGAEREEVLYRKAKQYMDKVNDDDYDLGFDFKELRDPEKEQLLYSHLVFIDECDIIDEVQPVTSPAPQIQETVPVEQYVGENVAPIEDTVPENTAVPVQPEVAAQSVPSESLHPEVVTSQDSMVMPEVSVIQEAPVIAEVEKSAFVAEAVPPSEQIPFVNPEPVSSPAVQEAIKPDLASAPEVLDEVPLAYVQEVQPKEEKAEAEEWVSLQKRGAKMLVPDPPHLRKPILSKEAIGSQNAEKRRQSRAKTMAEKKGQVEVPKPEPVEPVVPSRSLLRQVTEPAKDKNTDS